MVSWAEFEAEAPEIAAAGRRLLFDVSFLATVSRVGRPRVHPFCPAIADGRLWAFIMDESPKRRDIEANGYFAIHALPGPEDEEFYVTGAAIRIDDAALRALVSEVMPYDDADERHILYEVLARSCAVDYLGELSAARHASGTSRMASQEALGRVRLGSAEAGRL